MKALIIKTSSLGDLIHTLPALSDAAAALPGIEFDWVVEESFAELPAWHPAVDQVIPVAIRRWRKGWLQAWRSGEISEFREQLRRNHYDFVIDAQGLIKSALIARWANGLRVGLDRNSAREPLAALAYDRRIAIPRQLHAIERLRRLFAHALGYSVAEAMADYGLKASVSNVSGYIVLLHGTTWASKLWPEYYWVELAQMADAAGYGIHLPWGSDEERRRAERIIAAAGCGQLLPQLGLSQLRDELGGAAGVVGVDSGLAHLAAALSTPAVTLYGPTKTGLTGAVGSHQSNLQVEFECAPCMLRECSYTQQSDIQPACFSSLPPELVWAQLQLQMGGGGR